MNLASYRRDFIARILSIEFEGQTSRSVYTAMALPSYSVALV